VTPVNGPTGLTGFHGIYSLGACENLSGPHTVSLKKGADFNPDSVGTFNLDQYVTGSAISPTTPNGTANSAALTNSRPTTSITDGVMTSGILIPPLTAEHLKFVSINDSLKKHFFWLKVCLRNGLERRPVIEFPLSIVGVTGKAYPPVKTDTDGCVRIEDSIEFDYFSAKCWFNATVGVQNSDLGLNEKIPVKINPMGDSWIKLTDLRHSSGTDADNTGDCAKGKSTEIASSFSMDKVRYDYMVDESLSLKIFKTGVFNMSVKINRPSIDSDTGAEPIGLPVGDYLLRWAVVDTNLIDYKNATGGMIYGVGEKKVKVNGGSMIQDELTLSLTNIKAIGNTNYILFEVLPADASFNPKKSNLEITTFRAPMVLAHDSIGGNIEPLPDVSNIIPKLKALFEKDRAASTAYAKRIGQKDIYAQENGLTLVNLNQGVSPLASLSINELRTWLATGQMTDSAAARLCSDWANAVVAPGVGQGGVSPYKNLHSFFGDSAGKLASKCRDQVGSGVRHFFDLEFHYLTEGAHRDTTIPVKSDLQDLTLNQSFALTRSYSVNHSSGSSRDVQIGLKADAGSVPVVGHLLKEIPVINMISASAGMRYQWSDSTAEAQTTGNTVTVQAGKSIAIERIGLRIAAPNYEKCLVIRMNANVALSSDFQSVFREDITTDEKIQVAGRGYMLCAGTLANHPIAYDENYYVLNQKLPETQVMNVNADSSRPFFAEIRSRNDFARFISYIQGSYSVPPQYLPDYQQTHMMADPGQAVFLRGLQAAPGQLILSQ